MEIFMDLISTPSVTVPIFIALLVAGIIVAVIGTWAYRRYQDRKLRSARRAQEAKRDKRIEEENYGSSRPNIVLSDWFENYPEPQPAEDKEATKSISRPAEGARTAWFDELLNYYQLGMEIDSDAGVVRLHDRKFFELKKKTIEVPVSKALEADYKQAKHLLGMVRFNLNRRAKRQGIAPVKHRMGVSAQ